ncbi:hypothetical protein KI688_012942 [Linnemannia hyalina]|uniref:Uncharacterized protein n=1 Tax=Linnemannia hyalina TaxID=64524 RepID=A0A9P8BSZ0_9FUNG|nr:hypothetical protein KI688_012942 [Linnemannia hyalina]
MARPLKVLQVVNGGKQDTEPPSNCCLWIRSGVKNEWLDPVTYAEKGYVLKGSIKTDGLRIQLLAFKLRELQDIRY